MPTRFSNCWYQVFDWEDLQGAESFAVSGTCAWTVRECFLDEGMRSYPGEAPPLRTVCFFSFLAESGSAHDAEAPPGAKDVHDPDHRSVQVCLPGPHSVPPKLQTHLTPGPSPLGRGTQLHLADGEAPPDAACSPSGARMAGAGRTRAPSSREPRFFINIMYYFI